MCLNRLGSFWILQFHTTFDVLRMSKRIKWLQSTLIFCPAIAWLSLSQKAYNFAWIQSVYKIFCRKEFIHTFCCKNDLCTLFCRKKNLRTLFLSLKRFTRFFCRENDLRTSSGKFLRVESCHPESSEFLGLWLRGWPTGSQGVKG